ncbi:uncharacterized protein B0H64DRAFT_321485 [Chaetomium fimeti]|uniref:Uncharacterized protein n=1 Tax=Chaetomium fimeti TaxID=1854472 RepID=A0AAE0HH48_9PEZI|nr:hypothetical protein B0H64DRAFT_321485 [Chaetomium fimeti]
MTRVKRGSFPAAFLSLTPEDRGVMERAASIMKIPLDEVTQLIAGPSHVGQGTSLGQRPGSFEPPQRPLSENHDIENDTSSHDDEQPNDDDNRDSGSDGEISVWRSSAAEFNNIDDGITKEYEYVDPWGDDFPILAANTAATQGQAIESNTRTSAAALYGLSIQPPWSLAGADTPYVPSLVSHFTTPSTTVTTPAFSSDTAPVTQQQSWEVIEKPQTSQLPPPSFGWSTVGGYLGSTVPSPSPGNEDTSGDALRFVSMHPLQPQTSQRVQRRGPFQDRKRQEETSRTRGLKACVRCRMQRIRKVHSLPCLRYRLTECTLYRTGKAPGLEFTFRWPVMKLKDISEWESQNLRTVLVKSDVCEVPLKLVVRRFIPIPHKDSIHRSWVDHRNGVKKFKKTTPYAVVNMKNAVQDMRDCARITAENYHNARKHGLLRRYAIPNFIADQHHSANVFLSHYHYRTESSNPFKQDWKRRHQTPFSYMSVDDIQFLERTKVLLEERGNDVVKTNRDNDLYEHELYFLSQMFEDNWQPRDTAIDHTEGTVNNVGLKKYAGDEEGGKR